uniref:Translocation protein SEC62 n=1 Tax=Syphacia muris TaxID=451379 RepID=A0A0N5ARL7_9BILA
MHRKNERSQKLTKEEDAIAQYVRFNCPTKTTMFEGNEVHYFSGSKAVDTLYESEKYGHKAKVVKFGTRAAAVSFLRSMLEKGLFFRARKLVAKKKNASSEKKQTVLCNLIFKEDEEKKKRKIKLELLQDQSFNDSNDVYVWIFDPTPMKKKIIGALMILGTIAGCLFSLWPIWLRQLVYYLSLFGIGCFGLIFFIAIARTVLFYVIWTVTMGRHNLWILPNLSENCGFFESFQPLYTYEYLPTGKPEKTKKKEELKKVKSEGKDYYFIEDEKKWNDEEKFDFKKFSVSGDDEFQQSEEESKENHISNDGWGCSEEGSASDTNNRRQSQVKCFKMQSSAELEKTLSF